MPFLKNSWYVAAWNDEVGATPLGRRILDIPIVMFRTPENIVVALSGMCPHRFAPLSLGKIIGGNIQCPYHGLQFDSSGACVLNPHGAGATPDAAHLRSYPLVERHGAFWIWMGDSEYADAEKIPAYSFLDTGGRYVHVRGYMHAAANYELLSDNIMDLTHVEFLHPTTLGSKADGVITTTVRRDGNKVHYNLLNSNAVQGPLLNWLFDRPGGKADSWTNVVWEPPGLMLLTFGITDVGKPRETGGEMPNVHLMTPETERTTHYFWASARDFKTDDAELSQKLFQGVTAAFGLEDKPMIEAQQAMMGGTDLWALNPVLLSTDTAPIQARRILKALIAEENRSCDALDPR